MFAKDAFGPDIHQVRLERLKMMASSVLPDDMAGVAVEPEVLWREELRSQMLQLRAVVTAAKRQEEPYVVSDELVKTVSVPERPVRDGMLLWLSSHTPGPLARFCHRCLRLREIPENRLVMMQKLHYYGCPHIAFGGNRSDVHLMWMATQSGQIESNESGAEPKPRPEPN